VGLAPAPVPAAPEGAGGQAATAGDDEADDPWRHGDPAARAAWFSALRRHEPAAARALLAHAWPAEPGESREALLPLLAEGLSAGDEPLLDRALDDRRGAVRRHAAVLLARLPGSAFVRRARQRATAVVTAEGGRLVVEPPAVLAPDDLRDGLGDQSPAGAGSGPRWWTRQAVAQAPLAHWTDLLDTDPSGVVALPVDGDWREVLLDGWVAATLREQHPAWAAALLPEARPTAWRPLIALLPASQRDEVVAAVIDTDTSERTSVPRPTPPALADDLLRDLPGPWGPQVTQAVLRWLAGDDLDWRRGSLAGHRLPPGSADEVRALARRHPDQSLQRRSRDGVADLLDVRRAMLEELR
jgi:hypothetical protein